MRKRPEWLTIANMITMFRCAIGIIGIVLLFYHSRWPGFTLITIAFLLDKADGWAAYHLDDSPTDLGALLDRLADKFLIIGIFSYLVSYNMVFWLPVVLIVLGEGILAAQAIQSFRNISKKETDNLKAGRPGKIKMLSECLSGLTYFLHWRMIGNVLIIVAIIMMVLSIYDHIEKKAP